MKDVYGSEVVVGFGETVAGRKWRVYIRRNNETDQDSVFVNDVLHSSWDTPAEAFAVAEAQVEVQKLEAEIKLPEPPQGVDIEEIVDDWGWLIKLLPFILIGGFIMYGLRTLAIFIPKKVAEE